MTDDDGSVAAAKYPTFTPRSSLQITKLTRSNYNLWKAQIMPYLRGQRVFGFIDGTISPLSPTLTTTAAGKTEINPDFDKDMEAWTTTDQMILSTITASLSDEVLLQVYNSPTSAAIWSALQQSFASQSRAKLIQLRQELATTRKNELSASAYYFKLKSLADDLHLAGHPLSTDDFITYILAGLGPEYDSLVTMISTNPTITAEDLYAQLLTVEARIQHHRPTPLLTLPAAGPQSNYTRGSNSGNTCYGQNSGSYGTNISYGNYNNNTTANNSNRGRGFTVFSPTCLSPRLLRLFGVIILGPRTWLTTPSSMLAPSILRLIFTVVFLTSKDQLADLLTKPLGNPRFAFLKANLRVYPLPKRLRGRVEDMIDTT